MIYFRYTYYFVCSEQWPGFWLISIIRQSWESSSRSRNGRGLYKVRLPLVSLSASWPPPGSRPEPGGEVIMILELVKSYLHNRWSTKMLLAPCKSGHTIKSTPMTTQMTINPSAKTLGNIKAKFNFCIEVAESLLYPSWAQKIGITVTGSLRLANGGNAESDLSTRFNWKRTWTPTRAPRWGSKSI